MEKRWDLGLMSMKCKLTVDEHEQNGRVIVQRQKLSLLNDNWHDVEIKVSMAFAEVHEAAVLIKVIEEAIEIGKLLELTPKRYVYSQLYKGELWEFEAYATSEEMAREHPVVYYAEHQPGMELTITEKVIEDGRSTDD